ncbi:hypothetical protein F511_16553 [Dorcoceras hygrometricum]|uniref:Uncharacterized protein n=1 Tax=Dorcoceras hygrometricum TaxID=472368 RepID=A0A2Z7ASQ5_9LAMI|nr:hypothetical protein F511_16553 [Dorcoceras hygrometricum]
MRLHLGDSARGASGEEPGTDAPDVQVRGDLWHRRPPTSRSEEIYDLPPIITIAEALSSGKGSERIPPFDPYKDFLVASLSAVVATRYICNMAPDQDLQVLKRADDTEAVGHFAANIASAIACGCEVVKRLTRAHRKMNSSRKNFDEAMGRHAEVIARLEELEALKAREEGAAKAQREVLEAELAAEKETRAIEREDLVAELEKANAWAGQEAERLKSEAKEEFLKSPEFDTLLAKKAWGYFKDGFWGCLAQFRANGYSEEEHPASFLDLQQALAEKAWGYFKDGFWGCLAQFRANGYSEEEHPASFLDLQQALPEVGNEEEAEGEEEEEEEENKEEEGGDDANANPPKKRDEYFTDVISSSRRSEQVRRRRQAATARKGGGREEWEKGGRRALGRTSILPPPILKKLSLIFVRELRSQYLCDPQWFKDTASHEPTTCVTPKSQFRTDPSDHDSIGYPCTKASCKSSTTKHRLLHASGPHTIPPPDDPNRVGKRVKVRHLSCRVSMTFRVVRANLYNQDLGLIHSTNGNHLESPNQDSSIDHQVTIHLHAQNITMFPTNDTWYFTSQMLVSNSSGLILILTAQSTRNEFRTHNDY